MNDHIINTLLCVDDDEDILNLLVQIFKIENYEVLTAKDGEQALEIINKNEVGVVLCDHHMSGICGVELLTVIRDRCPSIIRILLTGGKSSQVVIDAINKGAVFKYISKPWDQDELILTVKEAFEFYHLRKANEQLTTQLKYANKKLNEANNKLKDRVEEKAEQIAQLTFYDNVTDLPNKTFLIEWLSGAITQSRKENTIFSLSFIGIDRFRTIIESLGHASGDKLLQILAYKMAEFTRKADAVCRIDGDEFCIVSSGSELAFNTCEIAERIIQEMANPLTIDGKEVYLTVSAGISIFPDDGIEPHELLRNAEAALSHAKKRGGNCYQLYNKEFNSRAQQRLSLSAELHNAIKNNEFILYYQPKVCSKSLQITGAEALLRWQHPARGLVYPGEFIPILEDTGLIRPVGEWVIDEVCKALRRLHGQGFTNMRISANLSPVQFKNDEIVGQIRNIALDNILAPLLYYLELEVTEGVLIDDLDRAKSILESLHDEGITLAIDDFGTGYSALSYLIKLPFDHIKIDISFVRQMGMNRDADAVVRAIVLLAQSLRLKSIAEGVETEAQAQALSVHGCDEFQGYLFGRPCPEKQFIDMLKKPVPSSISDIVKTEKDLHQDKLSGLDLVANL